MPNPLFLLAAIISLAFLIVVHEGGHYFVARWCKMRIERFSIGFGPAVLKRKSKKTGTTFQLAPIPFGGFVEIRGMNIAEDVDPDDRFAYPNRPVWQRFVTIFAGPATNYLSAIVLAFLLFSFHGVDVPWFGVDQLVPGYDAAGKLEHKDRIVAVDGRPLSWGTGHELSERVVASNGAPLRLTLLRNGQTIEVTVQPRLDDDRTPVLALGRLDPRLAPLGQQLAATFHDPPVWRIGVLPYPQLELVHVGVIGAAGHALAYPVEKTKAIAAGLYGIVFGKEKADPGGPVRIVHELNDAFSAGIVPGISLVMMLSVYLGLFNLLPVPALDGGRLVFLLYEMVTRRRANPKVETMVHMAGILTLGVVMVLVLIIDIKRFL